VKWLAITVTIGAILERLLRFGFFAHRPLISTGLRTLDNFFRRLFGGLLLWFFPFQAISEGSDALADFPANLAYPADAEKQKDDNQDEEQFGDSNCIHSISPIRNITLFTIQKPAVFE
jgi:hypothetical protein